jgi:hypothetical protein
MANERFDFVALRTVEYPKGQPAYLQGMGVMAQVVRDLGLVVGEDVAPARPDVVAVPAAGARRAEWAGYALAQGADPEKVDAMTREQLRAAFAPKADEGVAPAKGA